MNKAIRAAAVEITRRSHGDWYAETSEDEAVGYRDDVAAIIERHWQSLAMSSTMVTCLHHTDKERAEAKCPVCLTAQLVLAREYLQRIAVTSCTLGLCEKTALAGLAGIPLPAPTAALGASEQPKP